MVEIDGLKLEVANWRILLDPEIVEEKTSGGIIIPDSVRDKEQQATIKGKVLDVGPTAFGTEHDIMALKKDDTVYFAKYSGSEVKLEKTELRVINDEDVIIVIRGEKNG